MRTQERRDEATLQIGVAMAFVLVAAVVGGLATLLVHTTIGLSDRSAELLFCAVSALTGLAVVATRVRRRT